MLRSRSERARTRFSPTKSLRNVEVRYQSIGSDSLDGRRLSGTVLSYTDEAVIPGIGRERFEPMAFSPIGDSILNFQHVRHEPLARTGGGGLVLTDSLAASTHD